MARLRSAAIARNFDPSFHAISASRPGNTSSSSCSAIRSRSSLNPIGQVLSLCHDNAISLTLGGLSYGISLRDNAEAFVDRAHVLANSLETSRKPEGTEDAGDSAHDDGAWCANGVGQGAGQQAAKWSHADEGHGVVTHHAPAHFLVDERLDDRVASCQTLHHAKTG